MDLKPWVESHALDVRLMRGDAANVEVAINDRGLPGYCAQLSTAVLAVRHDLPTPDPKVTDLVAGAMHDYSKALSACVGADRPTVLADLAAGDRQVRAADARATKLGAPLY